MVDVTVTLQPWLVQPTPLDDYIARPEEVTEYEMVDEFRDDDLSVSVTVYKLTTLQWRDGETSSISNRFLAIEFMSCGVATCTTTDVVRFLHYYPR